ncbi:ComF family protein [Cellulomonas sp. ICMP 17802]|uniref:ComF family protein n=1 Tax=Cellulomonas sp. ICMP 17802 TaxID=3239199 RepID=UPI00351BAE7E
MTFAHDLLGLLLPVGCAGCGTDDVAWCPRCAARLAGPPWRCEDRAPRLDRLDGSVPVPVWTLADCTGDVRRAIVAWKDRGRLDLTRPFAGAARRAAATLAGQLGAAVLVVPAPSTAASRRRRGVDLAGALAGAVAGGLADAGLPAELAPVLVRAGGRDQVGLGARDRARNLAGQVRVPTSRAPRLRGRAVLLVDDVLTTGATLAASRSALERAGAHVVGGFTLASTPGPAVTVQLPAARRVSTG